MNTRSSTGRWSFPVRRISHLQAFTLMELLVTITIAGILAALVVPTVAKMRSSARSVKCLSNLRQMAPAFQSYASDHDGRFPLSHNLTTKFDNSWWFALGPYLWETVISDWSGVRRICAPNGPLGCPETDVTDKSYPEPWISYEMTRAHRAWMNANGGWNPSGPGLPLNRITSPARSLLVAEGHGNPDFDTWTDEKAKARSGLVYPHNGRTNVLFADGHVSSHSLEELKQDWTQIYTPAIEK